ncbi:hypothetical protein Pan216_33930 [Planctomycetes bacterium Pan216]|uniref:Uncharacterized protein n=1 Tax=Kolteria novifilia TaxID=2527975 RepID=A0A518B6D8_9BACT|nr:hypothetical protein Pan216_33930 [Planctomycetes bacterium Pan216]
MGKECSLIVVEEGVWAQRPSLEKNDGVGWKSRARLTLGGNHPLPERDPRPRFLFGREPSTPGAQPPPATSCGFAAPVAEQPGLAHLSENNSRKGYPRLIQPGPTESVGSLGHDSLWAGTIHSRSATPTRDSSLGGNHPLPERNPHPRFLFGREPSTPGVQPPPTTSCGFAAPVAEQPGLAHLSENNSRKG